MNKTNDYKNIPSMAIDSNIVKKESLRRVQLAVLKLIREAMSNTFGPAGSNTMMIHGNSKDNIVSKYSKDGHTVLKSIVFQNPIEMSIQSELADITGYIEKQVGDGTTSSVELASYIFEELCAIEESNNPYQMMRDFHDAVENIKKVILSKRKNVTLDDIYKIALIATNGNTEIASNIKDLYEEHGLDVFIDVKISTDENSYHKAFDGLTLNQGYCDPGFTNRKYEMCELVKPRIYCFQDPIDTGEMISLLAAILRDNVYSGELIPTLIMAPKIGRDADSVMTELIEYMYRFNSPSLLSKKPPICIVTNFTTGQDIAQYSDICKLVGAKMIRKYIDPNIQKADIEKGVAPTIDNVAKEFYGTADIVEINSAKTKFINPKNMHDENGELTSTYNALVSFFEAELKEAVSTGGDAATIGGLKRRINSLKANMVDYYVGGITIADRDSLRALVEDAVLSCRSAANDGVGYAANFEGYRAVKELKNNTDKNDKLYQYYTIIMSAYRDISLLLYSTMYELSDCDAIISGAFENGCPMNITTGEYDGNVLTSINTDIVILDAISRIVTIMFTANQALVQAPSINIY